MTEREQRLRAAFAALDRGDVEPFEALFRADGQWLGVPGRGWDGATPI
jgi:ketosteroid isomerase-like protein